MNQGTKQSRPNLSQLSFSVVVGSFVLVALTLLGFIGGAISQTLTPAIRAPAHLHVLAHLRVWWTGPLGLIGLLLIVYKDRAMQSRASAIINTAIFFTTMTVLVVLSYLMLFTMYELHETVRVNDTFSAGVVGLKDTIRLLQR